MKRNGHTPTLIACFLHFDLSFMLWVLLGALGIFISEGVGLTPMQKGLVVAVPLLSGSLLRVPVGMLSDRLGAKRVGTALLALLYVPLLVGWTAGVYLAPVLGADPSPVFGASPALLAALVLALLAGVLVSALHAWLSISVKADQIISGTIINIFAVGITGYLNLLISQHSPPSAGQFQDLRVPSFLLDIPILGPLIDSLIAVGPIALTMLRN